MKNKKVLVGLMAGLLCMPLCAQADTTLEEVGTVQDADWIDGTNLLYVEGDAGYGIMTVDGTMLTEAIYAYNLSYEYGYISATVYSDSLECRGVLSLSGEEVIPCQYTYADILGSHWALGYILTEADASNYDFTMGSWLSSDDDTYLLIDTVDVYYMEDDTASVVATLTRDQFMDAYAEGKYINIQDRTSGTITAYDSSFTEVETGLSSIYTEQDDAYGITSYYENGSYGLKDADGNIILEPTYYTIYSFYGGYAKVTDGTLYGLIDEQGNEVLPVAYDDVLTSYYMPEDEDGETSGYNALGYFAVEQEGKLSFVTEGGTLTCGPTYAVDNMTVKGVTATITDMDGNELLISADGEENVLADYTSYYALNFGSGMLYEVNNENYDTGVIDWHGNEILPCEYYDVALSGDGMYMLVNTDYDNAVIYKINYDVAGASSEGEAV